MLEEVVLGQTRFVTPGLGPDPRGVALGRLALLHFPSLAAVVNWLRATSRSGLLDELTPDLHLFRAENPVKSPSMVVKIPAPSSYVIDRVAQIARIHSGRAYTGTTTHFVRYRDRRAPYGYDLASLEPLPGDAELALVDRDISHPLRLDRDIPLAQLLLQLSLRPLPPGDPQLATTDEMVFVTELGLRAGVMSYLWRNRIETRVAVVELEPPSQRDRRVRTLLYARGVPPRIVELFRAVPGIITYRRIAPTIAVEFGYAHPVDLGACRSLLSAASLYLFSASPPRVDRVPDSVEFVDIETLADLDLDFDVDNDRAPGTARAAATGASPFAVDLRLVPTVRAPRRVHGALIDHRHAGWLKRLIYALPSTALHGQRVAVCDRGILILASEEVDILPLGQALTEIAPGLLIPLGMELAPKVSPGVLADTLGHRSGKVTVFPPEGAPFQLADASLLPLERRALARFEVDQPVIEEYAITDSPPRTLENAPVSSLSLWTFRAPGDPP